jgi:hypothetical protein
MLRMLPLGMMGPAHQPTRPPQLVTISTPLASAEVDLQNKKMVSLTISPVVIDDVDVISRVVGELIGQALARHGEFVADAINPFDFFRDKPANPPARLPTRPKPPVKEGSS